MTFAWRNAEDEQAHREAELAEDVAANEEAGDTAEADEEAGSGRRGGGGGDHDRLGRRRAGLRGAGCAGCHTLAAAGSTGTTGPDLDGALKGKTTAFIKESIVDPNKEIAKGYPPDVMPQTFADLPPEELDALVSYLSESTSGK